MGDSYDIGVRLNSRLVSSGLPELDPQTINGFEAYLALLKRWNARLNLTAIRDEEDILFRHFLESIACARAIPAGVATLLDFGSGAGFPGIPIAMCRPEICVTLAESQSKKAAFLREALRTLGLSNTRVHGDRGESLAGSFDCVVMRAVDRMKKAVTLGSRLVRPRGWLVLMTTNAELSGLKTAAGAEIQWLECVGLSLSTERIIAIGARMA